MIKIMEISWGSNEEMQKELTKELNKIEKEGGKILSVTTHTVWGATEHGWADVIYRKKEGKP